MKIIQTFGAIRLKPSTLMMTPEIPHKPALAKSPVAKGAPSFFPRKLQHPLWSTPQAIPLPNYERIPFATYWQRFRGVFQRCVETTLDSSTVDAETTRVCMNRHRRKFVVKVLWTISIYLLHIYPAVRRSSVNILYIRVGRKTIRQKLILQTSGNATNNQCHPTPSLDLDFFRQHGSLEINIFFWMILQAAFGLTWGPYPSFHGQRPAEPGFRT